MEIKEVKRPIGFCAWDESGVKTKDETVEFNSFEDKFGEYDEASMEENMDIGKIRAQLLRSYQSLAQGKKGIIFLKSASKVKDWYFKLLNLKMKVAMLVSRAN